MTMYLTRTTMFFNAMVGTPSKLKTLKSSSTSNRGCLISFKGSSYANSQGVAPMN